MIKGLQSSLASAISPGLGPPRAQAEAKARWGSAWELGKAVGGGGVGSPPRTAPQSTCSKLSRAPFLFAPCPWPKMNKTPGVGGAIHGTRECVSRPAAPSH